ncbi:hypothetical protein [uncultured Alistipes sp.]|jgi:hypothetical protein|uniref:hypothetical protein n=1 Tax=uncultured Alistipes sp. TaxID=538949 RepID=UPI00272CB3B2|nr:hypothetical protein [uncultured Alistipes sp.]
MSGNKVRLGDCEQVREQLKSTVLDALGVALLDGYRRSEEQELDLVGSHAYEDAVSGTDAAGPARERVKGVLRRHGEFNAYAARTTALAARISSDGLDAVLEPEDVRILAGAMERAAALARARLETGLYREVAELDRKIMEGQALSDEAIAGLAAEIAQTDDDSSDVPDTGCKVIEFPNRTTC